MIHSQFLTRFFTGFLIIIWCVSFLPISAKAAENELLVQWKDQPNSIKIISASDIPASNIDVILAELQINPAVRYVERNVSRSISVFPDDPYANLQYYLKQPSDADSDVGKAWNTTTGDSEIVVAVIDTGVQIDHPDLVDNMWTNQDEIPNNNIDDDNNGFIDDVSGWDFAGDDNDPTPSVDVENYSDTALLHGTHVAGIIGATGNNSIGGTGVNWEVSIMPIRAFDASGTSSISNLIASVEYARANGADIINMSYGGGSRSKLEREAITSAYEENIISIAAAGNSNTNLNIHPQYPACYSAVFGVSATDADDNKAAYSSYGDDCIDVAAAGSNILSTYYVNTAIGLVDEYGYLSGTSMATPIVSGIFALLYSYNDQRTVDEYARIIKQTAESIADDRLGSGRINAKLAMDALKKYDAMDITAYHNSNRKTSIARYTRTREVSPYFQWTTGNATTDLIGYYVYFGTDKKNPLTHGALRSSRTYSAYSVRGNEKMYRLRIAGLAEDSTTTPVQGFRYLVDTKIKRPTWNEAIATNDGIELSWHQANDEHAEGYHMYRAVDDETLFQKITSSLISEQRFLDITALPGHTYHYKVRSYDDIGNESILSTEYSLQL